MGVIFGVAKKDATGGGGSEGVVFFGRNFSRLSFLNTSLSRLPYSTDSYFNDLDICICQLCFMTNIKSANMKKHSREIC